MELKQFDFENTYIKLADVLIVPFMELKHSELVLRLVVLVRLNRTFYGIETNAG